MNQIVRYNRGSKEPAHGLLCGQRTIVGDAVFAHGGKAVADFRGTWDKVTLAAGCTGLLFHDLRRSAVRNMVRGGVPETVCMRISGHKTANVFDRYNITSARDLIDAAQKIESAALSHSLVIAAEKQEETDKAENVILH
jgi:hypothetical protein